MHTVFKILLRTIKIDDLTAYFEPSVITNQPWLELVKIANKSNRTLSHDLTYRSSSQSKEFDP